MASGRSRVDGKFSLGVGGGCGLGRVFGETASGFGAEFSEPATTTIEPPKNTTSRSMTLIKRLL